MPKLDITTRSIVIGRHYVSELQNAVGRFYNVHRSTISRLATVPVIRFNSWPWTFWPT